ncbi:MAG: hypothetical protein WC364_14385 [Eubacteriales bacterium]|jgi:hypothetical protein
MRKQTTKPIGWTTAEEIKFLQGLGNYQEPRTLVPRKELLKRYVKSLDLRTDNQKMDIDAIRAYVRLEMGGL